MQKESKTGLCKHSPKPFLCCTSSFGAVLHITGCSSTGAIQWYTAPPLMYHRVWDNYQYLSKIIDFSLFSTVQQLLQQFIPPIFMMTRMETYQHTCWAAANTLPFSICRDHKYSLRTNAVKWPMLVKVTVPVTPPTILSPTSAAFMQLTDIVV